MNSPLADGSSSRLEISVQKTNGRRRNLAIVVLLDTNAAAAAIKITFGAAARWVYLHKSSFGIQLVTRSRKRYSGSKKKCSLLSAARFNCLYTRRVINPFNLTFLQLGNNKQTESPCCRCRRLFKLRPGPPLHCFRLLNIQPEQLDSIQLMTQHVNAFATLRRPRLPMDCPPPPRVHANGPARLFFFFFFLKSCPSSV